MLLFAEVSPKIFNRFYRLLTTIITTLTILKSATVKKRDVEQWVSTRKLFLRTRSFVYSARSCFFLQKIRYFLFYRRAERKKYHFVDVTAVATNKAGTAGWH